MKKEFSLMIKMMFIDSCIEVHPFLNLKTQIRIIVLWVVSLLKGVLLYKRILTLLELLARIAMVCIFQEERDF
jgi:hypothetical protein